MRFPSLFSFLLLNIFLAKTVLSNLHGCEHKYQAFPLFISLPLQRLSIQPNSINENVSRKRSQYLRDHRAKQFNPYSPRFFKSSDVSSTKVFLSKKNLNDAEEYRFIEKFEVFLYRACLIAVGSSLILDSACSFLSQELGQLAPQEILEPLSAASKFSSPFALCICGLLCRAESTSTNLFLKISAALAGIQLFTFLAEDSQILTPQIFEQDQGLYIALVSICAREIIWFGIEYKIEALICLICSAFLLVNPYFQISQSEEVVSLFGWVLGFSVALLGAGKIFEPFAEDLRIGRSVFLQNRPMEGTQEKHSDNE